MKQNKGHKLIIVCLIVLILVALCFLGLKEKREKIKGAEREEAYTDLSEEDINLIRYNGKWYKQNPKLATYLLIGEDGKQADFLLALAIDEENESYKVLQINRDTMADVPQLDIYGNEIGTKTQQIALAHTHSEDEEINCKNTVKAVSNLFYGVDIDHYVCVPMDIVPKVNDLVGGVPVLIEDDFSKVDESLTIGKTVVLNGEQALRFVRARGEMEDPTNIAREVRQRTYMHSLQQKAVKKLAKDSNFAISSLFELSPYITSDCTINQLAEILDIALKGKSEEIQTIKGEAKLGIEYMEFHVDEEALQKQVVEMFFVEE